MGQQCCSEDYANKTYNNHTHESFYRRPEEEPQLQQAPGEEDVEYVRNFVPVDRLPKLHPLVAEI